ncbi:MAG: ATP-binding protein [Thermoanaerobaculia bacterium]|nr:ATP-binding protein [Thermoanaerobaculia bacterium]
MKTSLIVISAIVAILVLVIQSVRHRRQMDAMRGAVEDLKEALQKQSAILDQRRHLLHEIMNGMGEGVLAINSEKRIVLANDRLRSLFGIDRPRTGRPFYEVFRNAAIIEAFERGLEGELVVERTVIRAGGEERQVEIRVFPLEKSTEIAAVALLIDVTKMVKLARIRSDFIADFSHEVRTPLAGLRSSIETIQDGRVDPEQQGQLHRIVERQLGRLERLVSDLAELNTIESGELVLHREPTEMLEMLRDLARDFSEKAGDDRHIAIVVEGDRSLANVDPVRVEQVFSNLIDNALRHAPESDEVRIEVLDRGEETEIRVSDRGPGIPRSEQEKVFHRFYRIEKSRSLERSGMGLGLAITKHLVLQHGGSVGVESEPGRGTTFIIRLPKKPTV